MRCKPLCRSTPAGPSQWQPLWHLGFKLADTNKEGSIDFKQFVQWQRHISPSDPEMGNIPTAEKVFEMGRDSLYALVGKGPPSRTVLWKTDGNISPMGGSPRASARSPMLHLQRQRSNDNSMISMSKSFEIPPVNGKSKPFGGKSQTFDISTENDARNKLRSYGTMTAKSKDQMGLYHLRMFTRSASCSRLIIERSEEHPIQNNTRNSAAEC